MENNQAIDDTCAERIQLDMCDAVYTSDSVYFKGSAFPIVTFEEIERVYFAMKKRMEQIKRQECQTK